MSTQIKSYDRGLTSFILPSNTQENSLIFTTYNLDTVAIIPTYDPQMGLISMIGDLLLFTPNIRIVIVDDSTPDSIKDFQVYKHLQRFNQMFENIHFIRTPKNMLKAGALNQGLDFIDKYFDKKPDVIFTFDDEVRIESNTIDLHLEGLYQNKNTGAVCSKAKVINKNQNILTRMQALEYHGFNISKMADNGFYYGPLVMQGMMVAFKYQALKDVGGFAEGHLIEDYDVTAKLKSKGWNVGFVAKTQAWTEVHTSVKQLWKQRVRWTIGGLEVVTGNLKNITVVLQDFIGHLAFLALLGLIIASFFIPVNGYDPLTVKILLVIGWTQFAVMFLFQIWTLRDFPEADWKDWVLRITLLPEFLYSNMLSVLLMGTYCFFAFNKLFSKLAEKYPVTEKIYVTGLKLFNKIGYAYAWGTKKYI